MYDLNNAYGENFFRRRASLHWRSKFIGDILLRQFAPKSVVDVGCGNADLLGYMASVQPLDALAIEGTENSKAAIRANYTGDLLIHDLRIPLPGWPTKYDLCLCLEVAEHLEQQFATILTCNLTHLSDTIVFSAAGPNQGGIHHENCQPEEYWFYKFASYGFGKNIWQTEQLRAAMQPLAHKKGVKAYAQNVIVYRRLP